MYVRKLSLENENNDSVFLWGARQVGKTTLLEQLYPEVRYYDLLKAKYLTNGFFEGPKYLAKSWNQ